jgi:hypothetical protein
MYFDLSRYMIFCVDLYVVFLKQLSPIPIMVTPNANTFTMAHNALNKNRLFIVADPFLKSLQNATNGP